MSADNYALIGIHPLAGTESYPSTLHGVYIGFMSNDNQPSAIPESVSAFHTHEKAVAYANELKTEYGETFLCDCKTDDADEQAPTPVEVRLAKWEQDLLYPNTKKTVRQVIAEYADTLSHIYSARTAGDFTWKGLLHEFMEELAMAEDE